MACPAAMFLIFSNSGRSQQLTPAGDDLAYRKMEEGANAIGMSNAAQNSISIAFRVRTQASLILITPPINMHG